jgi:DNA-binding IclR family transcriptional regulator
VSPGSAESPADDPALERSLVARVVQAPEVQAEAQRTPSEPAFPIGIDRSPALRLRRQLSSTGYFAQGLRSKRHGTNGARFFQLVSYNPDSTDLSELVDPILRAAGTQHGEATLLAVPARGSMAYAAFFPSRQMLGVREQLGAIRPMHCSAVGKAYLSALGDDALERELGWLTFEGGTPRAATDRAALCDHVLEAPGRLRRRPGRDHARRELRRRATPDRQHADGRDRSHGAVIPPPGCAVLPRWARADRGDVVAPHDRRTNAMRADPP